MLFEHYLFSQFRHDTYWTQYVVLSEPKVHKCVWWWSDCNAAETVQPEWSVSHAAVENQPVNTHTLYLYVRKQKETCSFERLRAFCNKTRQNLLLTVLPCRRSAAAAVPAARVLFVSSMPVVTKFKGKIQKISKVSLAPPPNVRCGFLSGVAFKTHTLLILNKNRTNGERRCTPRGRTSAPMNRHNHTGVQLYLLTGWRSTL